MTSARQESGTRAEVEPEATPSSRPSRADPASPGFVDGALDQIRSFYLGCWVVLAVLGFLVALLGGRLDEFFRIRSRFLLIPVAVAAIVLYVTQRVRRHFEERRAQRAAVGPEEARRRTTSR